MTNSVSLPPPLPKKSKAPLFLLSAGVLLFFAVILYVSLKLNGAHDWNSYKHKMLAKGESLDFTNFIPKPIPDDQNFALAPIVSTCYSNILALDGHVVVPRITNYISPMDMDIYASDTVMHVPTNYVAGWIEGRMADLQAQQIYYRALAAKTNLFPVSPQIQRPAQAVLFALSRYNSTIEELRQAARRPLSRFPANYDANPPANTLLPYLSPLKYCNSVLALRAVAELRENQTDKALADIQLSFRLIQSIQSEPFLISHLVRAGMLTATMQPIWEGLKAHQFSDAQLQALDRELKQLDFLTDFEFSMRGERAMDIAYIEYIRHGGDLFPDSSGNNSDDSSTGDKEAKVIQQAFRNSVPGSLYYQNEINVSEGFQNWVFPTIDPKGHIASPDVAQRGTDAIDHLGKRFSPFTLFSRMFLPAMPNGARRFAVAQSITDMARIACALERYRIVHNDYPEKLDTLSPQLIAQVPRDVIDGDPLIYQRESANRFTLYSTGWNQDDDGGRIALRGQSRYWDNRSGDWVWNSSATNPIIEVSY